jgi:hypothetical protein
MIRLFASGSGRYRGIHRRGAARHDLRPVTDRRARALVETTGAYAAADLAELLAAPEPPVGRDTLLDLLAPPAGWVVRAGREYSARTPGHVRVYADVRPTACPAEDS